MDLSPASLARLPPRPMSGVWYRAIKTAHLATALSVVFSGTVSSRFQKHPPTAPSSLAPTPTSSATPPLPYSLLYLFENALVAFLEAQALLGSPYGYPGIHPVSTYAWSLLPVHLNLQRVVDLTDPAQLSLVGTTLQELTGDWSGYDLRAKGMGSVASSIATAPTQDLGWGLKYFTGHPLGSALPFEGILSISARHPIHCNLVIFPQNLDPRSSVWWTNPLTGLREDV